MKFTGELPPVHRIIKKAPENGIWEFPERMGSGVGFIYVIFDKFMKRAYLGKKNYRSMRGKNKGAEADWRNYKSSSKLLKEMYEERPLEDFEFICIEQYGMSGALSYAETWTLCFVEAPTTHNWYNKRIEKVSWNVREPVTKRHKERINEILERMK